MERSSRGGEKRTAVWASPHEERGSDGAVAPPMCDHRVVLYRCVVREWGHPSGAAVAPGLHAAARTRRAARAVQGDVVSVWQVLPGTPSAPPIPAQRVARFDDHCTRNCLLQNKLRQRYSRSMAMMNENDTPFQLNWLYEEFFERGLQYFFPFATFKPMGSAPHEHEDAMDGNGATAVLSLPWLGAQYAFHNNVPFTAHDVRMLDSVSAVLT